VPEAEAHAGPGGRDRLAVAFGRVLRRLGLPVSIDSVLLFARSLALVGSAERSRVYWAGRSTLVRREEDVDTYDSAFRAFWENVAAGAAGVAAGTAGDVIDADGRASGKVGADVGTGDAELPGVRWSPAEVLRRRDFARCSDAELVEAHRLADLHFAGAARRSRRMRRARHATGHPDFRRTVRASLRTGGEPIRRAFLEPCERHRRVVLLLDVSGSMEPYARAFARFLHAAVAGRGRVDAFAMGTRLTRVTRELRSRDPDVAVAGAVRRAADWSGGTRLGECLRSFNNTWGIPGMARGAAVVILSDGWDLGAPEVLCEQMARLRRVAHRIVWVNPLKATEGYAPLAGGMVAALPYVDDFLEGHSIEALERLGEVISR